MDKISVITINFNNKIGLEKTIKSVICQSFKNYEFIVIDGGSTDGSKEVIEKYSSEIDYWKSEKDSGVYHALNKGIKVSTGDFLIFMNSGDTFYNDNVLEVVAFQFVSTIDIYYGNNYKVKSNGSKSLKTYPYHLDFSFFYNSNLNHQSTFIRKSLFEKYFYYNENYKIMSDWEFFIYTICKENVPYKYLNTVICDYDFTGMSSTGSFEKFVQFEKEEVLNKYFSAFIQDYNRIKFISSKRGKQFIYIQKFRISWKILKGFMSLLLFLLPKNK